MSISLVESADVIYERKYQILSKRCAEVKEETDRIYERLLRCKRLLGTVLYERRALKEKLERQYHERLSQVEIPAFREEDIAYELLISQKQACSSNFSFPGSAFLVSNGSTVPSSQSMTFADGSNIASVSSVPRKGNDSRLSRSKSGKKKPTTADRVNGAPVSNKKDPNAPRKPVNAYFIFCQRKRSIVQSQLSNERNGELDRKEVTRRLGQMWAALSKEEQNVFYDEYKRNKEKYGLEMEDYTSSRQVGLDPSIIEGTSQSSSGPSKPKRSRKSKAAMAKADVSSGIPSTASSPFGRAGPSSIADEATRLGSACCDSTIKMEASLSGVPSYYDSFVDNISSQSSLTPTLMDHHPLLDKLDPSPLTYVSGLSYFNNPSEDATDEVFLSSSQHLIESPDIAAMAVGSSSAETTFEQHSFNPHSLQAAFHHQSQSGINETPVP